MDHIFPLSLGGSDDRENLAAACYHCNEFKGAKIEAVDPETQQLAPFFNPRIHNWTDHLSGRIAEPISWVSLPSVERQSLL